MKRLRRWLLIFAALLFLMIHTDAVRATSLIFPKKPSAVSTSTTTTTTTTTTTEAPSAIDDGTTETENITSTKSTLTGIPQIDYIWDPNLPRELNGYNLSDYPFYSTVPANEDIDFRCDNTLHDGFYASVQHKCQVYHHCISGIRYDFLCANFTAFDQRTFICHFVSEVDCKNSHKFFHRNDALYKATTTTTTTTTTVAPPPTAAPAFPGFAGGGRQRGGRPRRPLRRRRPQVDYYYYDEDYDDDYYEKWLSRRRKQRPRTRRPDYEDDYDTRNYNENERANKRPYERDGEEYEPDRRTNDRPRGRNRPGGENRRPLDDDRLERRKNSDRKRVGSDERRSDDDRLERRKNGPVDDQRVGSDDRRSGQDDRRNFHEDRRLHGDRKRIPLAKDERKYDDFDERSVDRDNERRPLGGRRRQGNGNRRPYFDNDSQELNEEPLPEKREEDTSAVRPTASGGVGGSLFGRPRAPPKVARPVPLTEKKKYQYTTQKPSTTEPPLLDDDEYYDDDYDRLPPAKVDDKDDFINTPLPTSNESLQREIRRPGLAAESEKPKLESLRRPIKRPIEDDYRSELGSKSNLKNQDRSTIKTAPPSREEIRDDEDVVAKPPQTTHKEAIKTASGLLERERESYRPSYNKYNFDRDIIRGGSAKREELLGEEDDIIKPQNPHRETLKRDGVFPDRDNSRPSYGKYNEQNSPSHDVAVFDDDEIGHKLQKPAKNSAYQERESFRPSYAKYNERESIRNAPKREEILDDEEDEVTSKTVSSLRSGQKPATYSERDPSRQSSYKDIFRQREQEQTTSVEQHRLSSSEKDDEDSIPKRDEPLKEARPIVRVVKRPFLPSRGGSPYLPRGLQPVGVAQKSLMTETTPIDMGSTISGVRILEHAAPIVRAVAHGHSQNNDDYPPPQTGPRTTQPPQVVDPPKVSLDEIYDNEYDVTLNDALNPTIKPLTPNRGLPIGFSHANKFDRNRFAPPPSGSPNFSNSDSLYASTRIRKTAIETATPSSSRLRSRSSSTQSRTSEAYYEDEDYDY